MFKAPQKFLSGLINPFTEDYPVSLRLTSIGTIDKPRNPTYPRIENIRPINKLYSFDESSLKSILFGGCIIGGLFLLYILLKKKRIIKEM